MDDFKHLNRLPLAISDNVVCSVEISVTLQRYLNENAFSSVTFCSNKNIASPKVLPGSEISVVFILSIVTVLFVILIFFIWKI